MDENISPDEYLIIRPGGESLQIFGKEQRPVTPEQQEFIDAMIETWRMDVGKIDQLNFWKRTLSREERVMLDVGINIDNLPPWRRIIFEIKYRIPWLRRRMRRMRKVTKYPF